VRPGTSNIGAHYEGIITSRILKSDSMWFPSHSGTVCPK